MRKIRRAVLTVGLCGLVGLTSGCVALPAAAVLGASAGSAGYFWGKAGNHASQAQKDERRSVESGAATESPPAQ